MVHVVIFHIGDHGNVGMQLQKGAVALVCLGHQILALAQLGIGAQVRHFAAHDDGRRNPGIVQRHAQHGGSGGLAMRPCHGNALIFVHQRRIDIRAVQAGDAQVTGSQHLRVVMGDGRGHHDGICPADILGLLAAQGDLRSQFDQILDYAAIFPVRAGDLIAQLTHNLGQGAHACPADAYEMNFFDVF